MSLILDYLKNFEENQKKYGGKTCLLMQVGSFYECYSTENRGPDLTYLSNLMNVILTRKDKSISQISEKNPRMMGFPCVSLQKNLRCLIEDGWTVIVMEQTGTLNNGSFKREITGVYSPATYIEDIREDNNYLLSIFIEEEEQKQSVKRLTCIGICGMDLNIGKTILSEYHSTNSEPDLAWNRTKEMIIRYQPKEILIFNPKGVKSKILEELSRFNCKVSNTLADGFEKISYQQKFLEKIYGDIGTVNIFEYLELETKPYCTISLMNALNFCYLQNPKILKEIPKPIFQSEDGLYFGNNSASSLNLIGNDGKNLFNIIDFTNTVLGRRLLKSRLLHPDTDIILLNSRYQYIQNFKNLDLSEDLKSIKDLERYLRRITLGILHPFELFNLYYSLIGVQNLIKKVKDIFPIEVNILSDLKKFFVIIESRFQISQLNRFNLKEMVENFYLPGIHQSLDGLESKADYSSNLVEKLVNVFNGLTKEDLKFEIKETKKDGQYLTLTKKRGDKLEDILSNWENIEIEGVKIPKKDFLFSHTKTSTKIKVPKLSEIHTDPTVLKLQISNTVKKEYLQDLSILNLKYKNLIQECVKIISEVDFLYSGSLLSKKYNYCTPEIVSKEDEISFVNFVELRHPIIERIIDYEYIPHSMNLDKDSNGILLYGLNSSGKSSLQKSIGISIILAQIGYSVPARNFQFYPYKYLLTRIDGNDNLFKGLSSFALEMNELKNILRYRGKNTLIIGDEVCKGTEYLSANSILAATIITLSKSASTFIFASHLHDIPKIPEISCLENVKCFHLKVELDNKTGDLIFNRELLQGQGDEFYGIMVASNIIGDSEFISLTNQIKNGFIGEKNSILHSKFSRYNSDIIIDKCEICGKGDEFEVHHINFQKDCKEGFVKEKPHIQKNGRANLVVLCEECHQKIHTGKIEIKKRVNSTSGKKLN
jgi:DNA mismatch repair protein MutS